MILINLYDALPTNKNKSGRYPFLVDNLTKRGHHVTWITSCFRHGTRSYRWPKSRTIILNKNLTIQAFWAPAYNSSIGLKRLYNDVYLAKQISCYLSEHLQSDPPDLILCSVAPIFLPNTVARLADKFAIPFVVDVQDIYPDAMISLFPRFLKPVAVFLTLWIKNRMRETFKLATAITSLSQTRLNRAIEIRGEQPKYSAFFYLPYKGDIEPPLFKKSDSSSIKLVYLGSLGKFYDLETVLKSLKILKKQQIPFTLDIFGTGPKLSKLKRMVQRYQFPLVSFHGYIPFREIEDALRACDVGLVAISKDWPPCIPNKPIDYMGLGLPVISSVSGQLHDMIEKYDVGKNYEAGNPKDLAKRIVWFHRNRGRLKEMGENAYRLVKKTFLADDISISYANFLVQIAKNSGGY